MKKILKRFIVLPLIFSLAIFSLTLAYILIQPQILEYRQIKEIAGALDIFGIPYETKEVKLFGIIPLGKKPVKEGIRKIFKKNIVVKEKWQRRVFENYQDNLLQGYVFVETRRGYGFNKSVPFSIMVGLKPDLETLIGFKPLDYGETPGLGGRMGEKWFQDQFKGKRLRPKISWTRKIKKAESDPHKFLAITGATNTTKGIALFLNDLAEELGRKIEKEAAQ